MMTTYQVKQNKLNSCKYIVFMKDNKRYKVQKLNDTDVYIWTDKSCLGDEQNLQLLKVIKSGCNKDEFKVLCYIANNYLEWQLIWNDYQSKILAMLMNITKLKSNLLNKATP